MVRKLATKPFFITKLNIILQGIAFIPKKMKHLSTCDSYCEKTRIECMVMVQGRYKNCFSIWNGTIKSLHS